MYHWPVHLPKAARVAVFGLRTHPGTTDSQRLPERHCAAEDAAHRAEDGDCLEAAEDPPELIPERSRGKIYTENP